MLLTHLPLHILLSHSLMQRKSLFVEVQYFTHLNLSISLLAVYITFVSGIETAKTYEVSTCVLHPCLRMYGCGYPDPIFACDEYSSSQQGACIFVAALLHYFLLASFCWMLCEGAMLYVLLVLVFKKSSAKWWYFFLFGWGESRVSMATWLQKGLGDKGRWKVRVMVRVW